MDSGRAARADRSARDRAHDVFGEGGPLDAMFTPRAVVVFGDPTQADSAVPRVLAAMTRTPFDGPLAVVHPSRGSSTVDVPVVASIDELPRKPDLAVLAGDAPSLDEVIASCATAGIRALAVFGGDLGSPRLERERTVCDRLRTAGMRMIGPGCSAVINPAIGLNASLDLPMPVAGSVAFIGQSGALAATVLDWSRSGIVGFSAFAAIGDLVDVGWGNLIDYFGSHAGTRVLLVQIDSIPNARSLLSAAREVALQKPIILIKGGRTPGAVDAFAWHRLSHHTDDAVLDAALRRVGVLRVDDVEELFQCADALSKQRRPKGPRLAVVSNAGSAGVLAADQVVNETGALASPTATSALPATMDVLGDGSSEPFLESLQRAIADPSTDGVLALLLPQVMADPAAAIHGLVAMHPAAKPVLLCVPEMGGLPAELKTLARACFPVLPNAHAAARTFGLMWRYSDDLFALYETPELHTDVSARAGRDRVGAIVAVAQRDGRDLTATESIDVLRDYGFEIDADGSRDGYLLQIGSRIDADFGPVLHCAAGGQLGELSPHRVVGLPPLNATLARLMIEPSPLFEGLRSLAARGALHMSDLDAALVRLSQLVLEHPRIDQIAIDPLVLSHDGARVGRARITLRSTAGVTPDVRPAFRPYPLQYVAPWTTKQGEVVTIRPIRAEDEPLMVQFHERLSARSVYQRYFQVLNLDRRTAHDALLRTCFVDYDRELALVAERRDQESGDQAIVAVAALTKLHRQRKAEVAVMVRDDYQRHGLGHELVRRLVDVAKDEGLGQVVATTMADNGGMCAVFRRLGFDLDIDTDQTVAARLSL